MAYTEQRTDSDGRTGYIGRFRVDGRLRSTRRFTAKREALAEARRQEEAGKHAEWVDPATGRVTVAEWFAIWQESRVDRAPRTIEAEHERFRSLVAPAFGGRPLRQVTHEDVARWAATMTSPTTGETASPARRRDAARLLVALLDAAVDARRLRTNPARTPSGKVPALPRAPKTKPHRYLSHEQLRRVADAARSRQARTLVLLTALTGLRWGEVSALTVADVDPLRRRVRVTKAYTRLDDGTLLLGDTKTHARREVPLPGALVAAVAEQAAGRTPADLLFTGTRGGPLRRESFDRSAFRPAVLAAGRAVRTLREALMLRASGLYDDGVVAAVRRLQSDGGLAPTGVCDPATWALVITADRARRDGPGAPGERGTVPRMTRGDKVSRTRLLAALSGTTLGPGAEDFDTLTLHDLRHTAASLAISGGATVKAVQRMLGHESPVLTLSTYAGLFEDDLDALGDTMSAAFQASAVVGGPAHGDPSNGRSDATVSGTAEVIAIGTPRAVAVG
ncbi:Phage integrase family protein [Promicromonospora umidemergens]|uniref:Tyr recombinase domain-containing protein n=1 Tax=Promicromonospora umidemergens TaxID=629679 RepID=A0ABP8XR26_9MICO|nr:tyrosine-type recombinase/integrase [Promicromonospora umidemergens]MCP2281936.1 Phage integrase family protein [Promicromonospora umidemergens]